MKEGSEAWPAAKRRNSQVGVSGYVPGWPLCGAASGLNPAPLPSQAHNREVTARPHRGRERWDNVRTEKQFFGE
ncbi:MAG: hypothetical protein JSR71_11430 [Proteobacteria bacterium]|nr:hypothetical protein [Pseudomonadota bacterium]